LCGAQGPPVVRGPPASGGYFFTVRISEWNHPKSTHTLYALNSSISVKGGCMPSCWLQFGWSGCSPASRYVLRLEQALFVVYKLGQTRRPGDPACRQIGRIHAALVARRRARAGFVYFCSRWQLILIVGGSGSNITLKRWCPSSWSSRYDWLRYGFVDALKACTQIILSNKKKDEVANALDIKNKKKVECYAILFSCLQ